MRKMPKAKTGHRIAPIAGNAGGGDEYESALAEFTMRNGQPRIGPASPRPQHDIEIERAGTPPLALALASETRLDGLQQIKHGKRFEIGLDDDGTIGIFAQRWADGPASLHAAGRNDMQSRMRQRAHCGAQDTRWPSVDRVALVRSQRDEIAVADAPILQMSSASRP